jgi:hypothetical protein
MLMNLNDYVVIIKEIMKKNSKLPQMELLFMILASATVSYMLLVYVKNHILTSALNVGSYLKSFND